MEEEKKRNKVILIVIGVVILLIVTIGLVCALFKRPLGTGDKEVTGATDYFTYTTTAGINITTDDTTFANAGKDRIWETSATVMLTANDVTNTADAAYYLYLDIETNGLTYTTEDKRPELIMEITDPENKLYTEKIEGLSYSEDITNGNGEHLKGYDITKANGLIPLVQKYAIMRKQKNQ